MNKSDFYYDLPQELIAQTPIEPRDSARLLVYDKTADTATHKHFYDLLDILQGGDLLIVNNTKVIPARIFGKKDSGATLEFLLHKRVDGNTWITLCRPAKRAKIGDVFVFSSKLKGEIVAVGNEGERTVRFTYHGIFENILLDIGEMPLPHYIKKKLEDTNDYQTVYAKTRGSAAAPTAGLHFTTELIDKLKAKGVEFAEVLLHVGLGTFLPVKTDKVEEHIMHSEYYRVEQAAADKINLAKAQNRRVIAVGTTSVRVLESCSDVNGRVNPCEGDTNIFIYPPYKFKCVDALITNFHLPESTLIMLVSSLIGREKTLELYKQAVDEHYRFYSFGDAMFLY